MLTMFGFIKKELKAKEKLALKYQGYVGQLYQGFSSKKVPINKTCLGKGSNNNAAFCYPNDSLELVKSSWELTARFDGSELDSKEADSTFMSIGLYDSTLRSYSCMKLSGPYLQFLLRPTATSSVLAKARNTNVTELRKGIWVKIQHPANSMTIKGSYSLDGKNYTELGSGSYSDLSKDGTCIDIHYCYKNNYINTDSIRLIHNGKLIFGKIED